MAVGKTRVRTHSSHKIGCSSHVVENGGVPVDDEGNTDGASGAAKVFHISASTEDAELDVVVTRLNLEHL